MGSSHSTDDNDIFFEMKEHWYDSVLFMIVMGLVFISIPFILGYCWISDRIKK